MKSTLLQIIDYRLASPRRIAAAACVTGGGLLVSYALSEMGLGRTVAPALPVLVWSGLFGGLVPAVISMLMIAVYSHLLLAATDLGRSAVVNVSYAATVAVLAWYYIKIHRYDSLNGNLARLQLAMEAEDNNIAIATEMDRRWPETPDSERREMLRRLLLAMADNRHHLAHLSTLVFGWMAIRREIDATEAAVKRQLR